MHMKNVPLDSGNSKAPTTLGVFEHVSFPDYGIRKIQAKIDTGAYTGALHCTNISVEQKGDTKILHFAPFDHPEVLKSTDNFLVRYVKSSNGKQEKRFFIETKIILAGKEYEILLSLADRSEMKWPVLIGRRFLRLHNLLVDPNKLNR